MKTNLIIVLTQLAKSVGLLADDASPAVAKPLGDVTKARAAMARFRARVRALKLGNFSDEELVAFAKQGRR